jgi:predicted signal transduction protein with EAL and GGDEF domain
MAARKRAIRHDDNTRAKIQAAQLINRLTAHAQGEVELSSTQVRAIEVLLRKTLPDLSDVRMEVDAQPITFQLDLGNKEEE